MRKERNTALSPRRNPRERDGFQESYVLTSGELRKCSCKVLRNARLCPTKNTSKRRIESKRLGDSDWEMQDSAQNDGPITNLLLSITALWLGRNWL